MIRVGIVTVNYNSERETHDCLQSLSKIHATNFMPSIVVVDNASEKVFQLTIEEKKQKITVLRTPSNLGFTGGYNTGIEYALSLGVDYLILLNNDTLVDQNCITYFLKTCKENTSCGIVVPKIYFAKNHEFHKGWYKENEKGKVIWYAGGYMDWANIFSIHRGVDEVDVGQYDTEEKITFATGCCMGIPTSVIRKVGMFDAKYFLYFEDADLSQRVLRAGYTIIYQPKSIIWHINAASAGGSGSKLHDYFLTRNRMLFGLKYAPIRSKLALLKESVRIIASGRQWQKKGIVDYYLGKFGKGSFSV